MKITNRLRQDDSRVGKTGWVRSDGDLTISRLINDITFLAVNPVPAGTDNQASV
jgi:hypothetical protein